MASETEYSNYQTVAAFIDATLSPYFRAAAIMPNLCHLVNFRPGSDSVKLRKAGSLTATAAAESSQHAVSEYTETSPGTLTAAEVKVYVELSEKALYFGGANVADLAAEAGRAIATKLDADCMALFDAFNGGTTLGTSGVDCTPALLLQAAYTVAAQNVPGPYVLVLHPVQIYDVQDDILASAASVWTNETKLDILSGQPPANNGYKGAFLDMPVYASTNVESLNSAANWGGACFSPAHALALGMGGETITKIGYHVGEGVTQIGVSLWYNVLEWNDAAGVAIVTDQ